MLEEGQQLGDDQSEDLDPAGSLNGNDQSRYRDAPRTRCSLLMVIHMAVLFGETVGEEGYSQKVICHECISTSRREQQRRDQQASSSTIVRLANLKLRDPPSAKAEKPNETAWVKFKTFKKWDVYGYCYGCHAKYKKSDCKTNSHTHRTTLCFQLQPMNRLSSRISSHVYPVMTISILLSN